MILLFTSLVIFFLNDFYVSWVYSKGIESQLPEETRFDLNKRVLSFIKGESGEESLNNYFNKREIRHLFDVRNLIGKIYLFNRLSVFSFFSFCLICICRRNFLWILDCLYIASIFTLLVCLVFILILIVDFEYFFIKFHEIFFSHGFWSFSEDDTIIQLYPKVFWVNCTINFIEGCLEIAGIVFIVCSILRYQKFKSEI